MFWNHHRRSAGVTPLSGWWSMVTRRRLFGSSYVRGPSGIIVMLAQELQKS